MTPCMFTLIHKYTHAYHKDEGAQTFCQGLTKQQVADLEEAGQLLQVKLLSAHVFFQGADETVRRRAEWILLELLMCWEDHTPFIEQHWAWTGPASNLSQAPPSSPSSSLSHSVCPHTLTYTHKQLCYVSIPASSFTHLIHDKLDFSLLSAQLFITEAHL